MMKEIKVNTKVQVDGKDAVEANNVTAQILLAENEQGIHLMVYGDTQNLYQVMMNSIEENAELGALIGLVCATIINAPSDAPEQIQGIKRVIGQTTIKLAKENGLFDEAMKYAAKMAKDGGYQ